MISLINSQRVTQYSIAVFESATKIDMMYKENIYENILEICFKKCFMDMILVINNEPKLYGSCYDN